MAGTLHIETLRGYLSNAPLMRVIRQKQEINDMAKRLCAAIDAMREAGVDESAVKEVQDKADEYRKISRGYGEMIESVWDIPWQTEALIAKYIDCCDNDIDKLPEYVKL